MGQDELKANRPAGRRGDDNRLLYAEMVEQGYRVFGQVGHRVMVEDVFGLAAAAAVVGNDLDATWWEESNDLRRQRRDDARTDAAVATVNEQQRLALAVNLVSRVDSVDSCSR